MKKLSVLLLALFFASTVAQAAVGVKYGNTTSSQATQVSSTTTSTGPLQVSDIVIQGGPLTYFDGSTLFVDLSTLSGNSTVSGDDIFRGTLYASGHTQQSTVLFSSSTTFQQANLPYALVLKAIGNNATVEASLLPRATPGQETTFEVYAAGPAGTWSIAPDVNATSKVASTGFTKITFNAVGQSATLLYLNDTLGYILKGTGSTGSTNDPTVAASSLN